MRAASTLQSEHYRFLHYTFLMHVCRADGSSSFFSLSCSFSFVRSFTVRAGEQSTVGTSISHGLFQIQVYRWFSFAAFQDSLNFLSLPRLYYGIVWCATNAFIRNEIICVMATFSGAFFFFFLYFCCVFILLTQHNLDSLREHIANKTNQFRTGCEIWIEIIVACAEQWPESNGLNFSRVYELLCMLRV